MANAATGLDRWALLGQYRRNRARSAQVFDLVAPEAFYSRPIPLRHPFVFYEGHLPAFSFLTLNERALGEHPLHAGYERLFERGIDPGTANDARGHDRADWPARPDVAAFARSCDERVERALLSASLTDPAVPRLVRGQSAFNILEHEQMHHETLVYIVHQLDREHQRPLAQPHEDRTPPRNQMRAIDAGRATLGAAPDHLPFGWDNEFGRHEVDVPAFEVMTYPVTNADWERYVEDGGTPPPFWVRRDRQWLLRCVFEDIALPRSWPVYVSHRQASSYATWAKMRLPTEAEYHRAAFSSPGGERAFPWGEALPDGRHGNFGFRRFDPQPVDAHPDGASAWGVHDLVGNGWEWTSTPFGPFPGFEPMASYPQYSADFFDGRHFVLKGASPVTADGLIRRSFRNWFFDDYPYMYAKFRCVVPA